MHLTRFTDYSLRVLIYSALLPEDTLGKITDVSECYDISRNHVVKIVHQLGRLGYLETQRGKGGGFRLCKAPADINIGAAIRDLEPSMDVIDCEKAECRLHGMCILKGALSQASRAFMEVLDGYTLEDICRNGDAISSVLFDDAGLNIPVKTHFS